MGSSSLSCRATAALLVAFFVGIAQADDTLEEAKQSLREWRNAFVNVHIRYTTTFLTINPDADYDTATSISNWTWTEDLYCLEDNLYLTDGAPIRRSTAGTGETEWFHAHYEISSEGEEFMESLTTGDSRGRSSAGRTGMIILPLLELWQVNPRCAWLPDVIDELGLTYEGTVEIEGSECVEYSYLLGENPNQSRHRLALDPAHGYLPKRVIFEQPGNPSHNPWRFLVTEFRETDTGTWFPAQGTRSTGSSEKTWTVDEVELNLAYDASDFATPALMNGTLVPGPNGFVAVGNGVAPEFMQQRRAEWEASLPAAGGVAISTSPPGGNTWIWFTLVASAGFLSFFFAWKLRQA